MLFVRLLLLFFFIFSLTACEDFSASQPSNYHLVQPMPAQPKLISPQVMTVNPAQLMHVKNTGKEMIGEKAVDNANKKSLIQPRSSNALNAIIIYPYVQGNLYEIYATPMNVTDVQLEPGEHITSVAAGDTTRWQLTKTLSGADSNQIEHILIKPLQEDLNTSMVVTTNERTYHLILQSTKNTYMSVVQWQYNDGSSLAAVVGSGETGTPSFNVQDLDFAYQTKSVRGSVPDWMPKAVFNDGLKTYIEFPPRIQSAPALFIKQSGSGDAAVNYRVVGNYYVVDQVITAAELTSGSGQSMTVVDIQYKH